MPSMQYLTPAQLAKQAPATQRLREKSLTLLDTAVFLRRVEHERGFLPVFAAQGTAHGDAHYGPTKGRHLVVAADRRGNALALLNSHTVHRKAWMGAGFVAQGERPMFVIGAAIPVARWRGFDEPLAELDAWRPSLQDVRRALEEWTTFTGSDIRSYASEFSQAVYLPGHKPAAAHAFTDVTPANAYAMMFTMLGRVLDGNLPAADPAARRVKPIKGPDALMHAGNAAFNVAVDRLRARGRLELTVPFPRYQKT
jgi:hypothetical protein